MARPKRSYETVEWRAQIPVALASQVKLLLLDATGNIPFAIQSKLTTELLNEWVRRVQAAQNGAQKPAEQAVDTGEKICDNSPLSQPT